MSKVALENVIEQAEHSKLVNLTTLHDATNLALTYPLTQLPNRILFNDRLEQAILLSNRNNMYGALLFIDLDNFKKLNDLHGHKSGDLVLIETALRLKSCIRNIDEVARLGGDEFTVILNNLDTDEDISISKNYNVAEKIRTTMLLPGILDIKKNIKYCCTTSIGVVLFNNTETVLIVLINLADKAMYEAKGIGGNSIRFIRNNGTFYST